VENAEWWWTQTDLKDGCKRKRDKDGKFGKLTEHAMVLV
jgi:hypothetical protein